MQPSATASSSTAATPATSLEDDRGLDRLRALARELDAEDPGTEGHSERVSRVAEKLALSCGWSPDLAIRLAQAALVHDVGKLSIDEDVLRKPGPLSKSERDQIRNHPDTGAEIAVKALDAEQLSWIRDHHERWDGAGYPQGVAGEAIPVGARLLALAEAWDAMTSSRVYGEALDTADALAECKRERGTQFAPEAVDALDRLWALGALTTADVAVEACRLAGETRKGRERNPAREIVGRADSPRHDGGDEDAAVVRDDAVVVAHTGQPPRLVHHDQPRTEVAIELAPVGDLGEEPEHVARLRAADAEVQERSLACSGQIDGPGEAGQIPRRRVLADPERRLALDPDRDRRGRRRARVA